MAKKTKKPSLVETWNTWTCPTCEKEMNFDEFKTHLKEVHQINETSGKKSMLMHMDGSKWFQSNYEWTIGGMVFHQSIRSARSKEDMMYWMGDDE